MRGEVTRREKSTMDHGILSRLALTQEHMLLDAFQDFSRTGGAVLDIRLAASPTSPAISYPARFYERQISCDVTPHSVHFADISKSKDMTISGELNLPFADDEFDWACSIGVIEHMGNSERQFSLVREMTRVVRRGVFLTTPNRRHPVKLSNVPRSHMLRAQDLYRFADLLPGKLAYDVGHKRMFGIKAHFFLMISKA